MVATLVENGARHGTVMPSFTVISLISLFGLLLITGLLTPYACLVASLIQMSFLFGGAGGDVSHLLVSMLNSGILAVLGPGAYSVDGRVFGRRVVMVPPGR